MLAFLFALSLSLPVSAKPKKVASPPSQAELEAFAEERRRRMGLPYDCLAGACLGERVSGNPRPDVVTVAGSSMKRLIEVCSGQIVSVSLYQAWVSSTPTVPYVLFDHGHFLEGEGRRKSLVVKMAQLGWSQKKAWDKTEATGERSREMLSAQHFTHSEKQGLRVVGKTSIETARYGYPQKWEVLGVKLYLSTYHPERGAFCKGGEGL
jgi:hypothetical protein